MFRARVPLHARSHRFVRSGLLVASALAPSLGCDGPKRAEPEKPIAAPSASPSVPLVEARPSEGCARTGSLDLLEGDPTCAISEATDDVNRNAMRRVSMVLTPDSETAFAGSTVTLRLTITNTSSSEASLVFDAHPRNTGPKPDWSRLGGIPEPKPASDDAYRLHFTTRTLDARDHNVDGLPTTNEPPGSPKLLRVRLRPGDKLTHVVSWWALGIPPPAAIFRDDAGHRIVPKTAPTPLLPGDYTVAMDVPIHGLPPAESTVTARIHVERVRD